jgi:hypothetical protein
MKLSFKPDLVLGTYMSRWHVLPKNRWFNIYLHRFTDSDFDRALHDHPWWSWSILLKGFLGETYRRSPYDYKQFRFIRRFLPYFRSKDHLHIMHLRSDVGWTIFITGSKTKEWGFEYPHVGEWMHNREFLDKFKPEQLNA